MKQADIMDQTLKLATLDLMIPENLIGYLCYPEILYDNGCTIRDILKF